MRRGTALLLSAFLALFFRVPTLRAESGTDSTFITRAGAVSLLVESDSSLHERVQWFRNHMPPVPLFSDVQQKQWYAPYLEVAFERGLIQGSKDGMFRPAKFITSREAALI